MILLLIRLNSAWAFAKHGFFPWYSKQRAIGCEMPTIRRPAGWTSSFTGREAAAAAS